jgi:hypothetical protein
MIVMYWTTESSVFWILLYVACDSCVTYFWFSHSFVIVVYVVSLKQIDIGKWLFCMDHRLVTDVLSVMTNWYHNIFRCVRCYSEYQVQVMERVHCWLGDK